MKIGIITFYNNLNYGSVLQAYALKVYLIEHHNVDAQIINYTDSRNSVNRKLKIKTYINRGLASISSVTMIQSMIHGKLVSRKSVISRDLETENVYKEFIDKYLAPYSGDYTSEESFDAFICGSDQVWKVAMPGLHEIFFLRFTEKKKRIAYAVSLGGTSVPVCNQKRLKKYIEEFNAISVREKSSIEVLKSYGDVDVEYVLDPTLLVEKYMWEEFLDESYDKENQNYVLCYFLDNVNEITIIKEYFGTKYKILWVDTGIAVPEFVDKIIPSPQAFVGLIKNAKVIFTDSFHACVFSIVFHKTFYARKRNYSAYPEQHIRVKDLLTELGLEKQIIESLSDVNFDEEISVEKYMLVDELIEDRRKISSQFLCNALDNIRENNE